MRSLRSFAVLLAAFLVASCSTDLMSPDRKDGEVQVIIAPSAGAASCTTSPLNQDIVDDIDSLMAILTPNNSSAQSKWQQVLDAIAANDPVAAQAALNNLIDFINLKYSQANTTGVTIGGVPIADFRDQLFLDMQCYVDKNLFDLNPNDPAKVFVDSGTDAGVYFPAGFVPQGYNVEVTTPTGSPLTTLFDQHPSFINIRLVDANGLEPDYGSPSWPGFSGEAIVAVCFPGGLDPDVYPRLRLGHQSPVDGFEILDKRAVPQALADALSCGGELDVQTTAFGRVIRSVAEFLLPEKLNAAFFAFGGVGGSPEEFSPFGAVDPGLSAFGGAGGSPEEFAPGIMPGASATGPAASTVSGGGTIVTGTADESNVTDPAQLPQVRVVTPSFATGVDGVSVTFELLNPDASGSDPITGPASNATLCGATTAVTSGGGYASVPCINFGTTPGYKNLRVTFDPTGVDPLACIINAQGLCATTTTSVNFLVETVAGAAAKIVMVNAPSSAQAGESFSASVRLQDQAGNNVTSASIGVTVSLNGGGTLAGTLSVNTDASGVATFNGLEIQGSIGNRSLTFTSGSLTSVTSSTIALQAGAAFGLRMATEPSTAAQAGVAFATQPTVQVVDEWDNAVAAANITVAAALATGDATLAGTLSDATNANGLAEFADLRIDGVVGDRTLKFTSTGLADVTSATTIGITPGAATKLVMVAQPSSTASAGVAFTQQPSVRLRDAWNNNVTGPEVSVAASITTGGAGSLVGTTPVQTVNGVATFTDLRIDGVTGSRTLDFTSGTLAKATSSAIVVGAGAASTIQTYMPTSAPAAGASYDYGNGTEAVPVGDAPRVLVRDQWDNPVDGVAVTWSPLTPANGAVAEVGAGATTAGGGLARITSWTLGQGANSLSASIAGSSTPATFTATAGNVIIAACTASGSLKKADLAKYSSTIGGYLGSLTTKAVNAGLIRSAELAMSVTGQSSGPGGYPTAIRAYRATSNELIASGTPYNASAPSNQTLLIPGDNGSPALIRFNLIPEAGEVVTIGEVIRFEVQVTAASNRTFQVWYNTKTAPGTTCAESKLVGTTIKGVNLSTRNYNY